MAFTAMAFTAMAFTLGLASVTQTYPPVETIWAPAPGDLTSDDIVDLLPMLSPSNEKDEVNLLAHAFMYDAPRFWALTEELRSASLDHFELLRAAYSNVTATNPTEFDRRWFYMALMGRLIAVDPTGDVIAFYEEVAREPLPFFDETSFPGSGPGCDGAHHFTQSELEAMIRIAAAQAVVYFVEQYDGHVPDDVRLLAIDAMVRIAADGGAPRESVAVVIASFLEHDVPREDLLGILPDERTEFADYKTYEPTSDFLGPRTEQEQ